jgi:hypothetical protein
MCQKKKSTGCFHELLQEKSKEKIIAKYITFKDSSIFVVNIKDQISFEESSTQEIQEKNSLLFNKLFPIEGKDITIN